METINEGTQVKYIGKTNDYTFKDDLSPNSIGIVKNIFEAIYGVQGRIAKPELALFPEGKPPTKLPRISPATKAKPSILNPGKAVSASPTPKAVVKR